MIRQMIGRDLKTLYRPPAAPPGAPILALRGLRTAAYPATRSTSRCAAARSSASPG